MVFFTVDNCVKRNYHNLSNILWVGFDPTGGNAAQADESDSPISRYGEIP